jgi:hypothetical protein
MGIKKYSSFDEARRDQWVFSPGQEYYRRIRDFYRFVFRLHPLQDPKGIFKYRDISEKSDASAAKNNV